MAVMLRSNIECLLEEVCRQVREFMEKKSGITMNLPILTLKGTQELEVDRLSDCKTGDTFLIHDQVVPEDLRDHSSFLWECAECGMCASRLNNVTRNKKCKYKGHRLLFNNILTHNSWGGNLDRYLKPYGCPPGHTGTGAQSLHQHQPSQLQQQPQPRTPSRQPSSPAGRGSPVTCTPGGSPPAPSTPSGSTRFVARVEQFLSPRPGPSTARQPALSPIPGTLTDTQSSLSPTPGTSRAVQPVQRPVPATSRPGRSTRKARPKYTDTDSEEDLSDSEGDEDYMPHTEKEKDEASDDSSDESEDNDTEPEEPEETAGRYIPAVSDTEDEDEDTDNIRACRRQNRATFRKQMEEKNRNEGDSPEVWNCECQRCLEVMAQFIVRPRIEMSTRWNSVKNTAPPELLDMVKTGKLPTSGTQFKHMWKDIASTPILYASGLRYFLGQLQRSLQESRATCHKLINGKLHLWQMLEFTEWNLIRFPEDPMPLIENISSPNMQKNAFCGYKQLLDSTLLWLARLNGGIEKFFIETRQEEGEDDKDYHARVKEDESKALDNRMKEMDYIQRIVDNMGKDKPWAKMEGTSAWRREQKDKFAAEYLGQGEVDSSCITRYLNHPLVIDFFDNMLKIASTEQVVSGNQMANITRQLLSITHIKQGHREEIWKKMTLEHWNDAVTGPDCAFPYVSPSQVDIEAARQMGRVHRGHRESFLDNEEIYVRQNLQKPDPLVHDDPLGPGHEGDNRELLVGKATVVKEHKTGRKYPAYIWFSQYDVVYLRAYESIRCRFLQSIGKDGEDLSVPFFINSKGEGYLTNQRMDWTWFREINQCGKFTSHKARKIMSDYIKRKKSAVMVEGREFTMCNSDTVDKDHYQSALRKKTLAMLTMATYRQDLAGEVETGVSTEKDVPYFSTEQRDRERRGRAQADRQYMERFFEAEETMLVRVQPTLRRVTTPRVRKALVDCLCACKDKYITSKGNMVDLFMSGDNVWSKACAKLILRMIFLLPQELTCVNVIKENILVFAQLSKEVANVRKLEWAYAWKLLEIVKSLKKSPSVESSALLYSLAKLNKAFWNEGNFLGYSFGNLNLRTSIQLMLSQQENKEKQLCADNPDRRTKEQFLAERRVKTLAYIEKRNEDRAQESEGPSTARSWIAESTTPQAPSTADGGDKSLGKDWDRTGRVHWSDSMKLELLRIWIEKVEDPMVRALTVSGKGPYKKQLKPLIEKGVPIVVDGETFNLATIITDTDTLAQFLQGIKSKGLSGQKNKAAGTGGLVHIIDEWIQGKEDTSLGFIRSSVDEIVQYAKENYC